LLAKEFNHVLYLRYQKLTMKMSIWWGVEISRICLLCLSILQCPVWRLWNFERS